MKIPKNYVIISSYFLVHIYNFLTNIQPILRFPIIFRGRILKVLCVKISKHSLSLFLSMIWIFSSPSSRALITLDHTRENDYNTWNIVLVKVE